MKTPLCATIDAALFKRVERQRQAMPIEVTRSAFVSAALAYYLKHVERKTRKAKS